jgi:hypothetical protein
MAQVKRTYNYSDVNVLTAGATIVESAIANQPAITAKRSTWTLIYFNTFKTRIADAYPNFLGVDNASDMRDKTAIVTTTMDAAMNDLTSFFTQIKRDLRDDKTTLNNALTSLGFNEHYQDAKKNGDQESAVELLFKFDQNMSTTLQTTLVTKGMDAGLITAIRGYATTLRDADISQEAAKTMRGQITDAALAEFNDIFKITMDICVICQDVFKQNKTLQQQFVYSKIMSRLDAPKGPDKGDAPAPTPI